MKSKNYTITLYENEEDERILFYIKNNYNYAYILHDKDITEDGERKKNHYHVAFTFENERHLKAIAEELNVEEYRIEKIRAWKKYIRYLIHKDNSEKYQYDLDEIESNINNINKYFKEDKEIEDMTKILEFIYTIDRYLYITEVLEFSLTHNCYATYRRAGNQIIKIIEEHNRLYFERKEYGN